MSGFFALILFLIVLVIGFVFEWQKGALEWNSFMLCAIARFCSVCSAAAELSICNQNSVPRIRGQEQSASVVKLVATEVYSSVSGYILNSL